MRLRPVAHVGVPLWLFPFNTSPWVCAVLRILLLHKTLADAATDTYPRPPGTDSVLPKHLPLVPLHPRIGFLKEPEDCSLFSPLVVVEISACQSCRFPGSLLPPPQFHVFPADWRHFLFGKRYRFS